MFNPFSCSTGVPSRGKFFRPEAVSKVPSRGKFFPLRILRCKKSPHCGILAFPRIGNPS